MSQLATNGSGDDKGEPVAGLTEDVLDQGR
jgi:hypothetical protein